MVSGENNKEQKSKLDWEGLKRGLIGTDDTEYVQIAPYAHIVEVSMTTQDWQGVFFSWLSLKGHLQGMHGLVRTELFAAANGNQVKATFIVIWTQEAELAAWLEHGYSIEEMLSSMGVAADDITTSVGRDFS